MIAIVGAGVVGNGMRCIFPDALMVDPPKGLCSYEAAAGMRLGIVCVPSPMAPDGSCQTDIVESAVRALDTDLILVKSTVAPGTCERLRAETGKRIVFSPEYMGESKYWTPAQFPQPTNPVGHGFVILGGEPEDCSAVADIMLPRLGPATRFRFMPSKEAELVKYAENAFFAVKVTFANELRRICEASGANYHMVREGWIDDPRVGPMHTAAFADAPGYGGKCYPKDVAALAAYCRGIGMDPVLLDATMRVNGC
jgi:UDPglucose 6-dehydrogenase